MSDTASQSVLIIDDDELVRETISDALGSAGYTVNIAEDGSCALEAIRLHRPQLVVCDIKMPGKNGFEVLKDVRCADDLAAIPFLFLSAYSDKQFVTAGYKIGADDFLTKPVDLDVLEMKVNAILRRQAEAAPAAAEGDGAATTPAPADKALSPAFHAALAQLMRKEGAGAAARVQLVSLNRYKAAFGERWPQVRERALLIAANVLRHHLGREGLLELYGDNAFLLLFPDLPPEEAQMRAEAAAADIRAHLLGTEGLEQLADITITADAVDPRVLKGVPGANGKEGGEALSGGFDRRSEAQAEAKRSLRDDDGDATWFTNQIGVRFRPVWSAAREYVAVYQCYPVRRTGYGNFFGAGCLFGGIEDPMAFHLDQVLAEGAVNHLCSDSAAAHTPLILPLHFSTLIHKKRHELVQRLQEVEASVCKRRLIIEMIGIPDLRGDARMRDAIGFMREFTDRAAVALHPADRHATLMRSLGVDMLMIDPEFTAGAHAKSLAEMDAAPLVRQSKRAGFKTAVFGVDTIDTFNSLRIAGALFMSGRSIAPMVEVATQPYELPATRIAIG